MPFIRGYETTDRLACLGALKTKGTAIKTPTSRDKAEGFNFPGHTTLFPEPIPFLSAGRERAMPFPCCAN